ncbi:hypothetical protein VH86_04580 [Pantoea sp. BL1]|nr:hypothetical protein VH86_04580 [Pantoea sp. BL1]
MRRAVRVGQDGLTRTIRRHDVEAEGTALAARGRPGSSSGATAHTGTYKKGCHFLINGSPYTRQKFWDAP